MKNINLKEVLHPIIIVLVSLLVEVFVFNMNSFRMVGKEYSVKNYTLDNIGLTHAFREGDNTVVFSGQTGDFIFLELTDINAEIASIYLDFDIPDKYIKYGIAYTDEANSEYYRMFYRDYSPFVEKTKYCTCHFNGKSEKLIIRIDNLSEGYQFNINEMVINKKIPMDFSVIRFSLTTAIILFFYMIRKGNFFYSIEKKTVHNLILTIFSVVFVFVAIILYQNSYNKVNLYLPYNIQLTDALINHKVNLDIEVSPELLSLKNPYDTSARIGLPFSWDTAYYNGNYYCYYGVVPALLFFVPYKLLTGDYMQCNIVIIWTYCIYLLLLDLLFIKFIRYKLPNIIFGLELLSMITINAATNIFFFAVEPTFYVVPYAVGLMFTALGFLSFIEWYTKKRNHKILLFLGGLNLSLAVGCRPPLLIYTLLIIPFGIMLIKQNPKKSIGNMISLLIPYIVIGSALAFYNYIRFDSILEFGQTYQLTAQDQLNSKHGLDEIPIQLWLGFFQPLSFSMEFPFVFSGDPVNNYAGQFFIGGNLTPLLAQVPFLMVLFSPTLWKKWKENQGKTNLLLLIFFIIIGFAMMLLIFNNAGVEWRYTCEFAPIMCITAFLLVGNAMTLMTIEGKRISLTLVNILTLFTLAVSFLKGLSGMYNYMLNFHPEFYYSIERLFCFWK